MKLVSWNIQWSRGVDGRVDPARIVSDARKFADFDVLCLQEVPNNFPGLAGSKGENQFEIFAKLLPDYTPVFATGVDIAAPDGGRRCFGNMILSRYPVLRVLRHQLPWPADPEVISMPRVAVEATLDTPVGVLRVMTTHLEYFSALQRRQQVDALRAIHAQSHGRATNSKTKDDSGTPFQSVAESSSLILTGDFNLRPDDPLHGRVQESFDDGTPRLRDAWEHLNGDAPHPLSVGIYDHEQWPEPFTCDFIFVSEDLLPRVRHFATDDKTMSSDHHPQVLELA